MKRLVGLDQKAISQSIGHAFTFPGIRRGRKRSNVRSNMFIKAAIDSIISKLFAIMHDIV